MVIQCVDCGVEILVGSKSPTKCTSLGYFDITFPMSNKQEIHNYQEMRGTYGSMMIPKNNVNLFERVSGTDQANGGQSSDLNKYIRLCCCCFQRRSMSGKCRIDFCASCDVRRKSATLYSTTESYDTGIYSPAMTLKSETLSKVSSMRLSSISDQSVPRIERCATLGFFKAHRKNIFKSKTLQYVHLCCNCYNDRPGMQVDPCPDCRERKLSPLYPSKYMMSGTVCNDCGLAIRQS